MRTIEIMVCYTDRTWDTHTAETDTPEDKLDELALMALLPERLRVCSTQGTIAAVSLYHQDEEVDDDKPETMEERLQRCCRLVFEQAATIMEERGEDIRKGHTSASEEDYKVTLAEVYAVQGVVERAYDLRAALVEMQVHFQRVCDAHTGISLPENFEDEVSDLLMDTSLAVGASKLLGLTDEIKGIVAICQNCGYNFDTASKFCPDCGKSVLAADQEFADKIYKDDKRRTDGKT